MNAKKIDLTSICSIELGELASIIKCFRTYVPSVIIIKEKGIAETYEKQFQKLWEKHK